MSEEDLAKIRFIADSMHHSFWGSNPKEQMQIEIIREEFAPYLFDKPPRKLFYRLRRMARELLADPKFDDYWKMYMT